MAGAVMNKIWNLIGVGNQEEKYEEEKGEYTYDYEPE